MFVVTSNSATLITFSDEVNRPTIEPGELVGFSNGSGSPANARIYIGRYAVPGDPTSSIGPGPTRLKWVNFGANGGGAFTSIAFGTQSPTITPHSASPNAMSVGAVNYFEQDTFASFTSKGPATILFAANGTRLGSPEVRVKPDFAALQGTNTTFFLGNDVEADGFPNFFGTSAAAPHAAAIAALVRQRFPAETPAQIYQRLRNSTNPFANPSNRVGDGLINAWESVYGDPVPATIPYTNGFESGVLGSEWATRRTQAGRTAVTSQVPQAGARHMTLDSTFSGLNGRSESTLHIDTTGFNNIQLSFQHRRGTSNTSHTMPTTFVDGSNTDGVAYSLDGVNWKRIVSLTSTNSTTAYQPFNFNLSTIASGNGDTLTGVVQIRFQQFDSDVAITRGHFHDAVSISGTPIAPPKIAGDVNNDTLVNVADVSALALFLDGQVGSVPSAINADFDGDGDVDGTDLAAIVNFIVND
jgi:hypothetical protein